MATAAVVAGLLFFVVPSIARAQIVGQVAADIHHSFIVGNATLPPGHYVFRMLTGSDLSLMIATRDDGKAETEFLVRQSIDSHTPQHTELVFDRYDNREFLTHIYESGDKSGATVAETSRIKARLQKQGKKPVAHTEESK